MIINPIHKVNLILRAKLIKAINIIRNMGCISTNFTVIEGDKTSPGKNIICNGI